MKQCYMCKEEKDESAFHKDKSKSCGLSSRCKDCGKKRSQKRKSNIIQYKDKVCVVCGSTNRLSYHHTDCNNKFFEINWAAHRPLVYSQKELEEEIAKCVLLCGSCHAKTHWGLEGYEHLWNGKLNKGRTN